MQTETEALKKKLVKSEECWEKEKNRLEQEIKKLNNNGSDKTTATNKKLAPSSLKNEVNGVKKEDTLQCEACARLKEEIERLKSEVSR